MAEALVRVAVCVSVLGASDASAVEVLLAEEEGVKDNDDDDEGVEVEDTEVLVLDADELRDEDEELLDEEDTELELCDFHVRINHMEVAREREKDLQRLLTSMSWRGED